MSNVKELILIPAIALHSQLNLKPGFHMVVRIASDARIAGNCDLRSLRSLGLNGNYSEQSIAILAILAPVLFKWKSFCLKDRKDRKSQFSILAVHRSITETIHFSSYYSCKNSHFKHLSVHLSRFLELKIIYKTCETLFRFRAR